MHSWHTTTFSKEKEKIAIVKKGEFFFKKNAKANKEKGKKEGQFKHIYLGKKIEKKKKQQRKN